MFDTIIDVDYLYHVFAYIPNQHETCLHIGRETHFDACSLKFTCIFELSVRDLQLLIMLIMLSHK